jgi:DNA-binding NtrC family response regulator
LRERGSDIIRLSNYLISRLLRKYRRPAVGISPQGERRLVAYGWPGNVRELANEIERAIVLGGEGEFDFAQLPGVLSGAAGGTPEPAQLDDWFNDSWSFPKRGFKLESAIDRIIDHALEQTGDNVSEAARVLGVSRDQVRYRLKKKNR